MKILAIGDIVAPNGREFVYNNLDRIRREYGIDFCVANGENACTTNGINREIAESLIRHGVDVITLGNHTFDDKEADLVLEDFKQVIRPLNYPPGTPGNGWCVADLGFARVGVINALGRFHMDPMDCPFRAVERALGEMKGRADVIIIDFHAETTSEKLSFGYYFDGRASLIFGTHTHVHTADERILSGGTAYITDIGMTGVADSVLGVSKDRAIDMFLRRRKPRYEKAEGKVFLHGIVAEIGADGRAASIERIELD